jgi:hypothetical protein
MANRIAAVIFAFALSAEGYSQDYLALINLYNRAQYDSIIQVAVPQFIRSHPEEAGLARYFLGESYYNKALAETDRDRSEAFFAAAWNEFSQARTSAYLESNFNEYFHWARYKLAWSSYRLAELNEHSSDLLKRAGEEFASVAPEAADSLKLFSFFMAAECRLRESLLQLYLIADQGLAGGDANGALELLWAGRQWLMRIVDFSSSSSAPHNLSELKAAAAVRRQLLSYYAGKLYQMAPAENFAAIDDPQKQSDARQTALAYFKRLNYEAFFSPLTPPPLQTIAPYLNMMKQFNLHFFTRAEASKNEFVAAMDKLKGADFLAEGRFRLAGVYQCLPASDETNFNERALSWYDSSAGIAEADYWMANIFMIEGELEPSRRHFADFIDASSQRGAPSLRSRVLIEDAQIKKFLLDFEKFFKSGSEVEFQKLAHQVNSFLPRSLSLRPSAARVKLLIHLALTEDASELWARVLTGTDDEKLQQALDGIRFVLSRAALNIGPEREKYIPLLSPLFEITQTRRRDATLFFRGILKTLEAEIQAQPQQKIENYKAAAALLKGVSDNFEFKDEADYVRGVCLFYAEEFEEARALFTPLINQQRNLRALFYVAEMFRAAGEGRAARECYQAIVAKLKDHRDNFSEYWYANALAGIASSDDSGDLAALAGIDFEQIEFLPITENELVFERLADEDFLKQQLTRESIDMLTKFGLPHKEIYPSKYVLKHSLFAAENIFANLFLIDEVRAPLTAQLKLVVLLPENIAGPAEALLAGELLPSRGGVFWRDGLTLNSEHELVVRHQQCYDYRRRLRFSKPGENKRSVVLTKKIDVTTGRMLRQVEKSEHAMSQRWDSNYILSNFKVAAESELLRDFTRHYELRDVALDRRGGRFLAVNAEENNIWVYSQNERASRAGTFLILQSDSLNSPEGIAIDSKRNVFIADWGNHRIVIFDSSGRRQEVIGGFGSNAAGDVGQPIKLMFPTRVAILEDHEGVMVGGERLFRETYLFIADQNGIHLCNLRGDYLGTALSPNEQFPQGSFYAFAVVRDGDRFKIRVVNRSQKFRGQVFEYIGK